jgi:hypothetical protein
MAHVGVDGLHPGDREDDGGEGDEAARPPVKPIYAKLEVASRAELSAKLSHDHVAPRLDGGRSASFQPHPQPRWRPDTLEVGVTPGLKRVEAVTTP